MTICTDFDPAALAFDAEGLIPGIVQSPGGEVRMLAYLNREALEATLATGFVTFWSRSRRRLWTKGESSGNRLNLLEIRPDCDRDALLILARPEGPTCHTGAASCFAGEPLALPWLAHLEQVLGERRAAASPQGSYTERLFAAGVDRIGKKVVEEAGEVILAAKNLEREASSANRDLFLNEAADLLFHLQLLLLEQGASLPEAVRVLQERHRARGPRPPSESSR